MASKKDYCAKARKREADLFKKLQKQPLEDLLGVIHVRIVHRHDIYGLRSGTLVIPLIAWQRGDGPVQVCECDVIKKATTRTITQMQKTMKTWNIVRFRARIAKDNVTGKPHALLVKYIGKDKSTELSRVVKELKKPVTFVDSKLGSFKLDRAFHTFDGKTTWNNQSVYITLNEKDVTNKPMDSLMHAKTLRRAQKTWERRMAACAADKLLDTLNNYWLDDGQKPISKKKFVEALTLESITVSHDGTFSFYFDDGDLFCGHCIDVRGSIEKGPSEAKFFG